LLYRATIPEPTALLLLPLAFLVRSLVRSKFIGVGWTEEKSLLMAVVTGGFGG
jgi:hypothetical protein